MGKWIIGYALLCVLFAIGPGPAVAQPGAIGTITEFPVPGAQPFKIVAGPDGALWFTELTANAIGRITTGGTITHFPLRPPTLAPEASGWVRTGQSGLVRRA